MSEPNAHGSEIVLSVIVPVYDQENVIADNVRTIRERVAAGLDEPFEVIVVSDGSLDSTVERVLESEIPDVRVLHYDRNLGKGYAIKTGAREARGRWVGYVDADLDLDPASLPAFVAAGEAEALDFAIGSKRHPDSRVQYPRSRVVASWFYQQLVRLLFRLNVTDTQVGLKVFNRAVAEDVMPLLLVKRYAFDLELLAVSRTLGHGRIKEMPVVLDYHFSGSGVRSVAVVHALLDTAAVFYRIRILHYYRRRRAQSGPYAWALPKGFDGTVAVIEQAEPATRRQAAEQAGAEVIAFLDPGSRPSANWLSSTTPFFARAEIAAVVTPQLTPAGGTGRGRAAAAIAESRLGSGSLHFRFTPGSIRFVSDFPARSFLVRRDRFLALPAPTPPESVVLELTAAGGSVLYVPEASVTIRQAPLIAAHLRQITAYGRGRGAVVRTRGIGVVRASTVGVLLLLGWLVFGLLLLFAGAPGLDLWLAVWIAYAVAVVLASVFGGLRFRSARVALLMCAGLPLTHVVYALSFVSGFSRPGRGLGWGHE